jgi:hypothetical protein
MYADMEAWTRIRRRVLVEGVSRRQVLRETGMHWRTLRKILEHSEPPGYRMGQRRPAASGSHGIKQFWRDALGGEWRCTGAGTPGTWLQIRPAAVTADPSSGTIPTD